MPDPSWPPAPAAWPFWLSDDGVPLPATFAAGVPAWDPRAISPQGTADAGAWPITATPPVDDDQQARRARRSALRLFGIGVAFFVVGAVSAIFASRNTSGGWIWTGGMLVGVSLFIRSFTQYRATKVAGPAKPLSVALVAVGLVACLGTGVGALVSTIHPAEVAHDAGSCWTVIDNETMKPVPCSESHQFKVSQTVSDKTLCPQESTYYVDLGAGKFGCLVDD
jgi:hypothetical protein